MSITAAQLVDLLDEKKLVPAPITAQLRSQIEQAAQPITPQAVLKLLTGKGLLQVEVARGLLAEKPSQPVTKPQPVAKAAPAKRQAMTPVPESDLLEDFGLLDELGLDSVGPLSGVSKQGAVAAAGRPSAGDNLLSELDPMDLADAPAADLAAMGLAAVATPAPAALGKGLPPTQALHSARPPSKLNRRLVIAGCALLALLAFGGIVLVWMNRGTGDPEFALAEQDYAAKNYAASVEKYQALLNDYPRSPQAGLARVHLGFARMQALGPPRQSGPELLRTATELLPALGEEAEFSQLQPELAELLTELAETFVDRATNSRDAEASRGNVASARQALELLRGGYVPRSLRPHQRLDRIEEQLALLTRAGGREADAASRVAAVDQALATADLTQARELRSQLLMRYPELADSDRLRELNQRMAAVESKSVRIDQTKVAALSTEGPSAVLGTVMHSIRRAPRETVAATGQVFAVHEGAAYALDVATGRLNWRRYLGGPAMLPVPVGSEPGGDVLLVDHVHGSLLRVAGATGELRWRLPVGEPIAAVPAVSGSRIYLPTRSNKLWAIDAATGNSAQRIVLSQPLCASPVIAANRGLLQLGDGGCLYVLGEKERKAVAIGHESGSVTIPPLWLPNHVLVVENQGAEHAVLHAIGLDASGLPERVVQRITVAGQVLTPTVTNSKALWVASNDGAIHGFQITADGRKPLQKLASIVDVRDAEIRDSQSRNSRGVAWPILTGQQLWIGGLGLRSFELAAKGRLDKGWSGYAADTFEQPPAAIGKLIVHARRAVGAAGLVVAAIEALDGKPVWETALACPLASGGIRADGTPAAAWADGSSGKCEAPVATGESKANIVLEEPAGKQPGLPSAASLDTVWLGSGDRAEWSAARPAELTLTNAQRKSRIVSLSGALAAAPIAWGGGLLIAESAGPIGLIDFESGAPIADPFLPPLKPGTAVEWRVAPAGESQLLAADGKKLYLLELAANPRPHLELVADVKFKSNVAVAAIGNTAYAASEGKVQAFHLPDLKPGADWKLDDAQAAWGPCRVGETVILTTDRDELACFGPDQKQLWKTPLAHGPLAGKPLVVDKGLIVASRTGVVSRLALDSGKLVASVPVGQPLSCGAVASRNQLWLCTPDGVVLGIQPP